MQQPRHRLVPGLPPSPAKQLPLQSLLHLSHPSLFIHPSFPQHPPCMTQHPNTLPHFPCVQPQDLHPLPTDVIASPLRSSAPSSCTPQPCTAQHLLPAPPAQPSTPLLHPLPMHVLAPPPAQLISHLLHPSAQLSTPLLHPLSMHVLASSFCTPCTALQPLLQPPAHACPCTSLLHPRRAPPATPAHKCPCTPTHACPCTLPLLQPRPASPAHARPCIPSCTPCMAQHPLLHPPPTHGLAPPPSCTPCPCNSPHLPRRSCPVPVQPTLQAEKTPSFSSFLPRGNPRTCALRWLARCCWLSPGRAGSLDPAPPAAPLPVAVPGPGGGRPGCAASGSAMPGPACAPRSLRLRAGHAGIGSPLRGAGWVR